MTNEGEEIKPAPEETEDEPRRDPVRIRQPKCSIKVEPLLVIAALSAFPLMMLIQQYIYKQMAKLVAEDHGIVNFTDSMVDTTTDPCSEGDKNDSSPLANYTETIQKRTSSFMIYINIAAAAPSLFVAVFLGAYSDKVGRKYTILPPLIASLGRTILYVIIIECNLSVYYMLLGSFIYGLGGGYETLLLGAFSYIADTTSPERRSFRIIVAEFCMMLPAILTPAGMGVWLQKSGFLEPFLYVLIGQAITTLYAIFLLPETIIPDGKARFFTISHIKDSVRLYTKDNGTERRLKLTLLLFSFFIFAMVSLGSSQVISLFMMNKPLCWGSDMIGYYSGAYVAIGIVGGVIVARVLKLWFSDPCICLTAGIAAMLQNLYAGFVWHTYMMFIVPIFACVSFLLSPTIRSIMSKTVLSHEQGALFGSIACFEVICTLLGSVVLNVVYKATVDVYTGFVFWVMAIILSLGCGILIALVIQNRREQTRYSPLQETAVGSPTEDDQ